SNALLWDNDQPEQYIDITPQAETPATNEIDELIGTLDTPETLTLSQPNDTFLLSRLKEDLNQTLQPQEVSHTNPYASPGLKMQINRILKARPPHSKSQKDEIMIIVTQPCIVLLLEK